MRRVKASGGRLPLFSAGCACDAFAHRDHRVGVEMTEALENTYQWNVRPRAPQRPPWFASWPGHARIAVQIIVLHEWESEPWHRSRPMPASAHHKFDFMSLGGREYGARHGIWRILDVLERHGLRATVLANGLTAALFPDSIRAARERGHEIAAHQWDQSVFPPMFKTRAEERDSLARCKEILERVGGAPVRGYMSPGPRPTPHTLEICAELGFDWTCDYVDADFPYFIDVGGRRLVSVSYATPGIIDFDLLPRGLHERIAEMAYAFDATYAEAARQPMKFCYAVHTHWGGTTGMARMLDEFLAHVRGREGVWFSRYGDVADFWTTASAANGGG